MQYLLAALTGVLVALAYPLVGAWPLIFVAYTPLLVAIDGAPLRRRLLLGWIAGSVATLGVQYWLAGTVVRLTGAPWWAAIVGLVLYCGFIGGQLAIFSAIAVPVRRLSGRMAWILTVPVVFIVVERLYPVVFALHVGNALWTTPVLMQSAEWIGVVGLSWLLLLSSCGLTFVIEEMGRGRTSDHFVPTAIAALWVMLGMWGLVRMDQVWSAPVQGSPTVALIQPNVTVDEKKARNPAVRQSVYRRTVEMTRSVLGKRPTLIVWPEGGFPFLFEADVSDRPADPSDSLGRRYSRSLSRFALTLDADLACGALRDNEGETSNSAFFFGSGVHRPLVYDKQALLLLGEKLPLAETFPALRDAFEGAAHYRPGQTNTAWVSGGFRFVPSICYEAIFPGPVRESLQEQAGDVILNLTNDVWFGDTGAAPLHLMLQQARAIENRAWLIRSTNSGISAFIDPTGTIRARTQVGERAVLAQEVPIGRLSLSFYRRYGDVFLYVSVIAIVLWMGFRNRRELRNFRARRGVSGGGAPDERAPE